MSPSPSPAQAAMLADVLRGNTQKNVNRSILAYLLEISSLHRKGLRWLDLPCGGGEFLGQVGRLFPGSQRWGADVRPAAPLPQVHYQATDLSRDFPFTDKSAFDIITSISGIMCFGNTAQFIGHCAARLAPGGLLVVSNDNCLTVRDRLSYLFTGRVRRFPLLFEPHEGNHQLVQHQELKRLFDVNGLVVKQIIYAAFYVEDLLYVPLAVLLWPWQWLRLRRLRNSTSQEHRLQLFGFKSLLYRHYVFIGEKPGARSSE